jgi:CcmD family protein
MMPFLQQAIADTVQATATAYDSVWANPDIPTQTATGIEAVMLSQDKLYVVLAVVLVIWIGLLFFLLRTDRKLDALERKIADGD